MGLISVEIPYMCFELTCFNLHAEEEKLQKDQRGVDNIDQVFTSAESSH